MSAPLNKDTDPSVQLSAIREARQGQTANHAFYEREPLLREIPDHGCVFALISGTYYMYSRNGPKRYRVAMTLV